VTRERKDKPLQDAVFQNEHRDAPPKATLIRDFQERWPQTMSRARFRPRLTNADGTPTAWWTFIGIIAPGSVVLSVIAGAIIHSVI
jgi:hypothetical protein